MSCAYAFNRQNRVTFIDEYPRFCWVYLLHSEMAVALKEVFDKCRTEAQNQSGTRVQYLRTDEGFEYSWSYRNQTWDILRISMKQTVLQHEWTAPLTTPHALWLFQANMSQQFCSDAIITAIYIKNIISFKIRYRRLTLIWQTSTFIRSSKTIWMYHLYTSPWRKTSKTVEVSFSSK